MSCSSDDFKLFIYDAPAAHCCEKHFKIASSDEDGVVCTANWVLLVVKVSRKSHFL